MNDMLSEARSFLEDASLEYSATTALISIAESLNKIAASLVLLDESLTQLRTVGMVGTDNLIREQNKILERMAVSLNYMNGDK